LASSRIVFLKYFGKFGSWLFVKVRKTKRVKEEEKEKEEKQKSFLCDPYPSKVIHPIDPFFHPPYLKVLAILPPARRAFRVHVDWRLALSICFTPSRTKMSSLSK
jgi:hypothetical protein